MYDEPSSALDEANTLMVAEMILEHQRKFNTVEIVITHQDELEEALNGTILKFEKDFRIRPDTVVQTGEESSKKAKKEHKVATKILNGMKTVPSLCLNALFDLKEAFLQVVNHLEEDDKEITPVATHPKTEKNQLEAKQPEEVEKELPLEEKKS